MARQLHGPVKWLALSKKTGTHWNHQVSYCFSISVFRFLWISPTLGFHIVVTWGLLPLLRSDPVGTCAHTAIRDMPIRHMPVTDSRAAAKSTGCVDWCRSVSYGHPRRCWKNPTKNLSPGTGEGGMHERDCG